MAIFASPAFTEGFLHYLDKIQWAPRIRRELVQRLYESDASGLQNIELCDDVGIRLFLRCETILRVHRREVTCPRCGTVYPVGSSRKNLYVECPEEDCVWGTTGAECATVVRK